MPSSSQRAIRPGQVPGDQLRGSLREEQRVLGPTSVKGAEFKSFSLLLCILRLFQDAELKVHMVWEALQYQLGKCSPL